MSGCRWCPSWPPCCAQRCTPCSTCSASSRPWQVRSPVQCVCSKSVASTGLVTWNACCAKRCRNRNRLSSECLHSHTGVTTHTHLTFRSSHSAVTGVQPTSRSHALVRRCEWASLLVFRVLPHVAVTATVAYSPQAFSHKSYFSLALLGMLCTNYSNYQKVSKASLKQHAA